MRAVIPRTRLRSACRFVRAHRVGARLAVLALALTAFPAGAGVAAAASSGQAARSAGVTASRHNPLDDPTASFDNLRTGWDPNEPGLSPSVVHGSTFGQVFNTSVSGNIYGQPLVIGSTLIAVTENNMVYGMDAGTGKINWSTSLGNPYKIPNCNNIAPNVGVTSAPVYDPSTSTVYVLANVNTGKAIVYRLFGLDISTGKITFQHGIYGSPSNDSHISFNSQQELQRPGLLLLNGWVYAAFSSHCDHKPYDGYVAAVNPSTTNFTLWSDEAGLDRRPGGHLAERRRPDVRRRGAVLPGLGQRRLAAQGSRQQSVRPARRVGDQPAAAVQRHAEGGGLLQPGQRPHARQQRPGLRLRRAGRVAGGHVGLPERHRAGRQDRRPVPAERQRPRRPRAGQQQLGQGPVGGRPLPGYVESPGNLRIEHVGDPAELEQPR